MRALLAGLTTFDVVHLLDHVPDVTTKTTSRAHVTGAGGPATNAAITLAALDRLRDGDQHADPVSLLTALGAGPTATALRTELDQLGVTVWDATDRRGPAASAEPAISSAVEHPGGRFVTSTNARVPVDAEGGRRMAGEAIGISAAPDVVLVDGHNPELAAAVLAQDLLVGPGADAARPGGSAGASSGATHPERPLRVLDGGSWKDAFVPLLGSIDVAVVSADFAPPGTRGPLEMVASLRATGIERIVRTDGPGPVHYWWDGASGEVEVPQVEAVSTMGAGDVFHGAFAWGLARLHAAGKPVPSDPADLIRLASQVAAISTRSFGTRQWMEDPGLPALLATW
jgi:sugar/nucleoside kinase (ribokinase family)